MLLLLAAVSVSCFALGVGVGLSVAADRRNARAWGQGLCASHAWFRSGEGPAGMSCRLCLMAAGVVLEEVEWPLLHAF